MPKFLDVTDLAAAREFLGVGLGVTPTAVKTSAYSAAAGDLVIADASSTGFTVTLPDSPNDRTVIIVKKSDSTSNVVTVQRSGSDVFNTSGGPSTLQMTVPDQTVALQYASDTGIWHVAANGVSTTSFDDRYYQIDSVGSVNRILDQNGAAALALESVSGAVNHIYLYNNVTGGAAMVRCAGADSNISLQIRPKGTGNVQICNSGGAVVAFFNASTTPANCLVFYSSDAGSAIPVYASGSDTNIDIDLIPKGTGVLKADGVDVVTTTGTQTLTQKTLTSPKVNTLLDTNGNSSIQLAASASASNYLYVENASFGQVTLQGVGDATDVTLRFRPKGSGVVTIYAGTGQTPTLSASGADTNHNLNLVPKGSGVVQANGNPVGVKVSAPASSSATGVVGQWAADSSYFYVCTAANTWRRVATETW